MSSPATSQISIDQAARRLGDILFANLQASAIARKNHWRSNPTRCLEMWRGPRSKQLTDRSACVSLSKKFRRFCSIEAIRNEDGPTGFAERSPSS